LPILNIRPLLASDLPWAEALVSEHFASPRVVSRGVLRDARSLPGLVAEHAGVPLGLLQYCIEGNQCEVVQRQGVGRALLRAVEPVARAANCQRLWLITTNNNEGALAFYRAAGWRQAAVHRGAVRAARRLKPELPERDERGTPIEDEIEFELSLSGSPPGNKQGPS
jgi:Acetyltransferase (GNAT) family